ncbi:MAG: hypothetical protein ACLUYK_10290 [Eggerthella lenta]
MRRGHLAATDVADYLAKRGLPFREAHAVVGHLVLMCEKRGCNLEDLPFEVFQEASPLFERDITEALDIPSIVAARTTEAAPLLPPLPRSCSVPSHSSWPTRARLDR